MKKNIKIFLSFILILSFISCESKYEKVETYVNKLKRDSIRIKYLEDTIKFELKNDNYFYLKKEDGYYLDYEPVINDSIRHLRLIMSMRDTSYIYSNDEFLINDKIEIKKINDNIYSSTVENKRLKIRVQSYYDNHFKFIKFEVLTSNDTLIYNKIR